MIGTHEVIDRAARKAGHLPRIERISARVWAVPVTCAPLPVGYTFAYILVGDAGLFVVIDPGAESAEGRRQLLAGIDAAGLRLADLTGVVATHTHWDHMGAAERLLADTDAWLGMHPLDFWPVAGSPLVDARATAHGRWLATGGVPDDIADALSTRHRTQELHFSQPLRTLDLEDGDYLPLPGRKLRVIGTPGHTAGSICIADEDEEVLFTGDHVLPGIYPNVGAFYDRSDDDTLGGYLDSLDKVAAWNEYQICPGHEFHFRGLDTRMAQLRERLLQRQAEVASAHSARPEASAWEITSGLLWRRGWDSLTPADRQSALAATRAHLNHIKTTN